VNARFSKHDRQQRVYSVEKLLFLSYSKNSRPAEAPLLLGRLGTCDLLLRATRGLLINVPMIRRVNWFNPVEHEFGVGSGRL
jgi:hypothetical protein